MKGLRHFKISKKYFRTFPLIYNFIYYWKFSEEPDRVDNFDDPYFDGVISEKYQTKTYLPMGHFKPISKIVDMKALENATKR